MRKIFTLVLIVCVFFLSGCELRGTENTTESASPKDAKERTKTETEEPSAAETKTSDEKKSADFFGRPQEETGIYGFESIRLKYYPGKVENRRDLFRKAETPLFMYELQNDFLNHWELWIEEKHNPDENLRAGITKGSIPHYEEHQETLAQMIEVSKEIKEKWSDVNAEVKKTCDAQKVSVKCKD